MDKTTFSLIHGNAFDVLKKLKDNSFQCCVTSPPYWALREYEVEENQIGREPTPQLYIENLVNIFFQIKRILREDGTLWLNIGDTFCGSGSKKDGGDSYYFLGRNGQKIALNQKVHGFKRKDMLGIPWALAKALQKPILKCKSCKYIGHSIYWGELPNYKYWCPKCKEEKSIEIVENGFYLRSDVIWHKPNPLPHPVADRCTSAHDYIFLLSKSEKYYYDHYAIMENSEKKGKRNKRDVWTVPLASFSKAHFAVFPTDLIEPCVLAGTSKKGMCRECKKPYKRIVKKIKSGNYNDYKTIGWEKGCNCSSKNIQPCTVIDPFNGAGTTGVVAIKNGRNYLGVDINNKYIKMTRERLNDIDPLFIEEIKWKII